MICEDGYFDGNVASERYSDVTGYIILNEGYVFENGYVEKKYDGENIHFTAQGQMRDDRAGLMREPDRTCLANTADSSLFLGMGDLGWIKSVLKNTCAKKRRFFIVHDECHRMPPAG